MACGLPFPGLVFTELGFKYIKDLSKLLERLGTAVGEKYLKMAGSIAGVLQNGQQALPLLSQHYGTAVISDSKDCES